MPEQLEDSDKAKPADARAAYIAIGAAVLLVVAFALFGHGGSSSNSPGVKGGDTGLKSGVEQATSKPELAVPR